ncbi:MAG: aminotransferase class I/II-fold pyridoxal phosphate-dependent enzyme [Gemmatimonadaceae bacterium]
MALWLDGDVVGAGASPGPHGTGDVLRRRAVRQDAAVTAISSTSNELERIRRSYHQRARAVVDALAHAPGVVARMPDAGMYVFADVRGTGMTGKQFARGLLDATGVSVTPGEGFGPSGAGHVRITLGVDEQRLRDACARITRFTSQVQAPVTAPG